MRRKFRNALVLLRDACPYLFSLHFHRRRLWRRVDRKAYKRQRRRRSDNVFRIPSLPAWRFLRTLMRRCYIDNKSENLGRCTLPKPTRWFDFDFWRFPCTSGARVILYHTRKFALGRMPVLLSRLEITRAIVQQRFLQTDARYVCYVSKILHYILTFIFHRKSVSKNHVSPLDNRDSLVWVYFCIYFYLILSLMINFSNTINNIILIFNNNTNNSIIILF